MDIRGYKRIMIIGNNGSGKSWLARELGAMTGLPVVHLDLLYWRPGWREPGSEEWAAQQRALVAGACWIMDGMHTATMELRFQAAELVIFLDMNRALCLARVLKRHGERRADMPGHLEDRLDRRFLQGLWRFGKERRPEIERLREIYPEKPFLTIKGRRALKEWLREWAK